jgi:BirA family biotin operon repressor/biotin-[acetyl-CoA-carboxylase] ligase
VSIRGELLESCGSTNDLAKQKGALGPEAAPHGTWISARVQTSGRGRMGRTWQSEPGNLFLSLILRPRETRHWTWIPLLGAVGVIELLTSGRFGAWDASRFSIKWPNDLWLDRKKFGGILCEAVSSANGNSFIVLGLGLNGASAPEGLDQPTSSLNDPGAADRIREPLAEWISGAVLRLDAEGPDFLREAYERWAAFRPGAEITWKSDGQSFQARVRGLGSLGELEVILSDGMKKSLYAEEVSGVRGGQA